MHVKRHKSDLPSRFIHEGTELIGPKNVADKFNEYFTEIGPKLAKSIDTANKAPFNHYLTTPCAASFNFIYTKPDDIEKITRNLKPKSSAGYDNISTKLLKEIKKGYIAPTEHYYQPITMYWHISWQTWNSESDPLIQERWR